MFLTYSVHQPPDNFLGYGLYSLVTIPDFAVRPEQKIYYSGLDPAQEVL